MKIEVNLRIILLVFLTCIVYKMDIYVIFFISILLHELFHAIFGIALGLKIKKIRINPLGFNIEFMSFKEKNRISKKIIIYLAGPLFNFVIALIFYMLNIDNDLKVNIVYTNLVLGIFNLLPILPLDGGKMLKEICNKFLGFKNSNVYVLLLSKVILIIISVCYSILIFKVKNIFVFLVIIYLWYLYYLEEKKLSTVIKVYKILEKVEI